MPICRQLGLTELKELRQPRDENARLRQVVDQLSRESPLIEVDFSMSGQKVSEALDRCRLRGPVLVSLIVDLGTEFASKALEELAWQRGVKLDFTQPGRPTDNSHIESFNGHLRVECLNVNQFLSIEDAKEKVEVWRLDYNHHRPHGSLGHLTPSGFIHDRQEIGARQAVTV